MARPAGRATIADVAAAAGVSRATVSRVLNGNTSVDPELCERVRQAADRLAYRPNLTALGLARGFTGVFGVVVPDIANPYFPYVLQAVEAAAGAEGLRVIVADSNEDEQQEFDLCEELSRRCDGLVLCSVRMSTSRLRRLVEHSGVPIVLTNRVEPGLRIATAAVDFTSGVNAALEHLAALGHRKVGYLAGPVHSWSNHMRLQAFEAAAERLRFEASVAQAGSTTEETVDAAPKLLDRGVTAILAFNDLVAFGALEQVRRRGLDTPGDVSIIGFDDIPAARFADPPLTTVRSPKAELGTAAWQLLREQLQGAPVREEWLASEFVARASTSTPRGAG